mmetsp:Transcript_18160/g.57055  ORF Transcript_18160/g.57055 Transcript_18160/m.57055 type:complete len:261 (+) Transcript_18160:512-1294(+)
MLRVNANGMVTILEVEGDHPVAPPGEALQAAERLVLAADAPAIAIELPQVDNQTPLGRRPRRRRLGHQESATHMGARCRRLPRPCGQAALGLRVQPLALCAGSVQQALPMVEGRGRAPRKPGASNPLANPREHLRGGARLLPLAQAPPKAVAQHARALDHGRGGERAMPARGRWGSMAMASPRVATQRPVTANTAACGRPRATWQGRGRGGGPPGSALPQRARGQGCPAPHLATPARVTAGGGAPRRRARHVPHRQRHAR